MRRGIGAEPPRQGLVSGQQPPVLMPGGEARSASSFCV